MGPAAGDRVGEGRVRMRLTTAEVAARLDLADEDLRALVRAGHLVPVSGAGRGTVWRFRAEDVERYEERAARVRLIQGALDLDGSDAHPHQPERSEGSRSGSENAGGHR